MSGKPETWARARLEILNFITSFCLSHGYGDGRKYPGYHVFMSGAWETKPEVGDLIALQSAPVSKSYLGWLDEIEVGDNSFVTRYLIRSIEDGTLCWWSNVGIDFLDREVMKEHPSWKWTDRQYAFKDRWWNVCFKEKDAYITLPVYPEFGVGYSVTLGTRTRHGFDNHQPRKVFPDWRKVTKAQMAAFYDECAASKPSKLPPPPDTGERV